MDVPQLELNLMTPAEWIRNANRIREWTVATPYLEEMGFSFDTILAYWQADVLALWKIAEGKDLRGVVATQIGESREGRFLLVVWAYSELESEIWDESLFLILMHYANVMECSEFKVMGRKGLEKRLAPFGFKFSHVTLSCPVRPVLEN